MTTFRHPLTAFTAISAICVAVVSGAGAASYGGSPIHSNFGAYDTALEARYRALSSLEANEDDSDDEWHFWAKARDAANGYMVLPDDPQTRELGAADMVFARATYRRILSAYSLGLPEREVAGMADVTANFDCWMNDAEEGTNPRRANACRLRVAEVLSRLEQRYPEKFVLAADDTGTRRKAPSASVAAAGDAAAADMPARPALPVAYTVFFGFDSAELRPDAQATIDTAARQAMDVKSVAVAVAGHADRAGPAEYNRALAAKRADAVVAALAGKGIPAVRIDEVARGEAEPAVPTPDGVAEPRNRRVVIEIDDR